ncbi:MAG: four helix bundle protein [Lewinella sp.]|jgi:four helix bundle protein|uniref:four helix bundle protein n=1 Tax=Lewinella sp. TaxID=2004506 RepID=UPI003D6A2F58
MGKVSRFEELKCWQNARLFVKQAYEIKGPLDKDYDARRQFRRAALSGMNNIAEGFGCFSRKEFIRFLEISQRSIMECKSMLYVFEDLGYLEQSYLLQLHGDVDVLRKQVMGLIRSLR